MSSSWRPTKTPFRLLPIPSSASPGAKAAGLPGSDHARSQAGAQGPPSGPAVSRALGRRPPGTRCGLDGGSFGRCRAAGDGFCGAKLRPPGPGGGENPHRAARGPGYGGMWNRAAARATDPGPTGRHWLGIEGMGGRGVGERAGEASGPPLQPPTRTTAPGNGGDTHMAELGYADLALSSPPGLVAPQLPLSPRPAPASPGSTPPPCSPAPPPARWAPPTALPQPGHP